ncbi:MAG: insulinase family protein [Thermoanaerobaculia bacterium]|nr:insulinase family protein [Thermoanaerobaculia bacterium]
MIPRPESRRLTNGLDVCILPWRRAPVVATALVYRAGTMDEAVEHGGTAHFLEHMMFKGTVSRGPGELDRLTRALGGSNNAYTSHDLTLYYFTLAADRWQNALELERDRMEFLRLDPAEVDSERGVILEELAMYEGEPWDALDRASGNEFFKLRQGGLHPYGCPVLGDRESLARIDAGVLGSFYRARYIPSNAVLTVVGDVDVESAFDDVSRWFDSLPSAAPEPRNRPQTVVPTGIRRVERRHGDMERLLVSLPAPPGDDLDHPVLKLLTTILASGRSSRLHRALVDEGALCVWVSADANETLAGSSLQLACEVLPGADRHRVELEMLRMLDELRHEPPTQAEIERARQIVLSDWVSGHERVDQLAFLFASSQALWSIDHPRQYLQRLQDAGSEDLLRVAGRYLDVEAGSVIAWSLPRNGA